jgi:hypothetical protein
VGLHLYYQEGDAGIDSCRCHHLLESNVSAESDAMEKFVGILNNMVKEDPFAIYRTWEPTDVDPEIFKNYEVMFNGQYGTDTGRKRFKVKCLRCGELLHHSTTCPSPYIRDHENNCVVLAYETD